MKTDLKISDRFIPARIRRLERLPIEIHERFLIKTCEIKMLILTDYGGSYGNADFGLSAFLKAFDEPLAYTRFDITKAHRRTDSNADIDNFEFDNSINDYDVIFLFGIERPVFRPPNDPDGKPLTDPELRILSQFMDNGGGVFATGDHEDLGVDMCGRIPRVKSMRRWYTSANPGPLGEPNAPSQGGAGRHDTIVDIDPLVPGTQGNQTDITPQNIFPEYRYGFASAGPSPFSILDYKKYPHPVLCSPDGVIKVLPDHMHEGLCEVPSNLGNSFTFDGYTIVEYPIVGSRNLPPEIVAKATNHVTSQRFGVIAALDGHRHSNIGRVLVDATWHHFFNVNIRQYQNIKDAVDNNGYTPNPDEQIALEKYNFIQHYFRNIAYWLAKRDVQQCYRVRGFQWLLSHNNVAMSLVTDLTDLVQLDKLMYFHTVGVLAKDALGDLQSKCQSFGLTVVQEFFPNHLTLASKLKIQDFSFIDPELFESVCMGCSLHNLNEALMKSNGKLSEEEVIKVVEQSSFDSMEEIFESASKSIGQMRRRVRKMASERG